MNKKCFLGLLVIVLVIGFIGCGGDDCTHCKDEGCEICNTPVDNPKDHVGVRTVDLFDSNDSNSYSATVEGKSLTDAEWNNVVQAVEDALNGAFSDIGTNLGARVRFRNVFNSNNEVVIIVEKTLAENPYTNWKAVGKATLYLNFDNLDNLSPAIVRDIVQKMNDAETVFPQIGKIMPVQKYTRQMMLRDFQQTAKAISPKNALLELSVKNILGGTI